MAIRTPSRYVSGLTAAIPSQVLPFEKIDRPAWYLSTFYPIFGDAGGGFACGAISQALVGFGLIELVLRGALVGFVFARVQRW